MLIFEIFFKFKEKYLKSKKKVTWYDTRPNFCEIEPLIRCGYFAKATGCPVYVVHMSVKEGPEIIAKLWLQERPQDAVVVGDGAVMRRAVAERLQLQWRCPVITGSSPRRTVSTSGNSGIAGPSGSGIAS